MKVSNIKEVTASQSELARFIGITQARVNQLVNEGVVIRSEYGYGIKVAESIRNYYSIKNIGVNADSQETTLMQEKTMHERAKRKLAELKLAKASGQVYDAAEVEKTLSSLLANIRTNLNSFAMTSASLLAHKDSEEILEIMQSKVEEILEEMTNFNPETFAPEVNLEADDDEEY